MGDISQEGRTVLFVSHRMGSIQNLCRYCYVLDKGLLKYQGPTNESIRFYFDLFEKNFESQQNSRLNQQTGNSLILRNIYLVKNKKIVQSIFSGDEIAIVFDIYNQNKPLSKVNFLATIYTNDGYNIAHLNNSITGDEIDISNGGIKIQCILPETPFMPGNYSINIGIIKDGGFLHHIENALRFNVIGSDFFGTGKLPDSTSPILLKQTWKTYDNDVV